MSVSAGDRLARLLALVPWLLANDGVTVAEAAEHFGVDPAALERDLWLLVVSGLPGHGPDQLVDIDFWDDGVIHVRDPQTLDRPLRLTPDEAVVLLVSLRMLAQIPGVTDRQAVLSAAAKVEAAVDGALPDSAVPAIETNTDAQLAEQIEAALARDSALRIRYAGASRDDVTDRTIIPKAVQAIDGVVYVEAWCASAEAVRTFRLDRIIRIEPADPPSERGPAPPADRPEPSSARLALHPRARWVADVHAATIVGEDSAGRVLVDVPMHSIDWAVRLVLSLRGHGEAVEPPALVEAVRSAAESALSSYPDHVG